MSRTRSYELDQALREVRWLRGALEEIREVGRTARGYDERVKLGANVVDALGGGVELVVRWPGCPGGRSLGLVHLEGVDEHAPVLDRPALVALEAHPEGGRRPLVEPDQLLGTGGAATFADGCVIGVHARTIHPASDNGQGSRESQTDAGGEG